MAFDQRRAAGADFSKLLKTGENPFDKTLSMPTAQQL